MALCKRCEKEEAQPGHRMGWCPACEDWRIKMINQFKPPREAKE